MQRLATQEIPMKLIFLESKNHPADYGSRARSKQNDANAEDFKDMETNHQALSFFGWPWWAWLICVLITVVLLGLVYIAVFWNDFKDCLHGREIFCSVSRDDK